MAGFVIRLAVIECVLAVTLFGAAGRWDLPWFWGLLAIHVVGMVVMGLVMDPDLRRERVKPGPGARDAHFRKLVLPFLLAHLVVAGLDAGRFGWSGGLATGWHVLGLVGYALGMGLSVWSLAANRFFSPVVRLQAERGHSVVSDGPYRFVRHPGYAGSLIASFSGGLAMGSWWSMAPLVPVAGIFLWRIGMEERFLGGALGGYRGYAERVRYRLCPGVW